MCVCIEYTVARHTCISDCFESVVAGGVQLSFVNEDVYTCIYIVTHTHAHPHALESV